MRSIKLPSWIDRLLGTAPVPPPPHVFAIADGELRYGSFHGSEQGLVFEASLAAPLPPDAFVDGPFGGPLADPPLFHEWLGSYLRGLPAPVEAASLVLPDSWLRLTFIELDDLPRKAAQRDEVLRWKLKRQVPFRVEDLRLEASRVRPFPGQEAGVRLLVAFAIEALVAGLEAAFAGVGVTIGRITNATLATLASLDDGIGRGELAALLAVYGDAYTLTYVHDGEPVVHRFKALGEATDLAAQGGLVRRDLRLTTSFMQQHDPKLRLSRALLSAPEAAAAPWATWLGEEVGVAPEAIAFEHFPLSRTQVVPAWSLAAPLVGAACQEIS